jgi:glycosyltransferase involved in cell wall biosynthesis
VLLDFAARAFEYDIALRVLTPRDGPLVGILNEIGVPTEVVPASAAMLSGSQRPGRLWSAPASLAGLAAWARRLDRHPFMREGEAFYSVGFKPHLALAFIRRHPVVWHLHEYPPAMTGAAWRALSRMAPDAMIANSRATAAAWRAGATSNGQRATERSGDRGTSHVARCTVVPNGVDLDRFCPRPRTHWIHDRLGLPHDQRLIGMPAVFARWKGQLAVIDAFAQIAAHLPDVHLVFVGGSIYDTVAERKYATELHEAVQRATGNGQRIHVLPFQSKIEHAYPEFDLVAHYSLRPEPFGRVILEAMASGVPVVAAGEGGPVEILGKAAKSVQRATYNGQRTDVGESVQRATYNVQRTDVGESVQRATYNGQRTDVGWLAPPRDAAALAGVLREALELSREQLCSLGEAGRRRAEDHFSARHFAQAVADVIRHVALGS